MANTYSQIYIHLVFSPKNRRALIKSLFGFRLLDYKRQIFFYTSLFFIALKVIMTQKNALSKRKFARFPLNSEIRTSSKKEWKDELEKYITGIVQNNKHKLLAIGAMPDHIHIFIGYYLSQTIPDLVENIKTSSNNWIKEQNLSKFKFDWQKGYGAFSHSHSQIDTVVKYIRNQEKHHRKMTFREEYLDMLLKNNIDYQEIYAFDFFEGTIHWE